MSPCLPDSWRLLHTEEVAEKIMVGIASAATHAYTDRGVLLLRNQNIREGHIDLGDVLYIDAVYELTHGRKRLRAGDVVTVRTGYPGLSAVVPPELHGAQCFTSLITRPIPQIITSEFLCAFINSPPGKRQFASGEAGAAQKNVNASTLAKMFVPVPPLDEQKAIVNVLSAWDRGIGQLEGVIAAKERRKRGLMQQLLTGKRRFPEFGNPAMRGNELAEGWERRHIGELFQEVTDKVGSKEVPPYSITAGTGFVSHEEKWGKNIAGSQHSNYTLLRKGQFSYNKGNSKRYPCGCMYLLKHADEIAVPSVFISFESRGRVCDEFYEQYFMADLCARELRKYITSGARSDGLLNISKSDFLSIRVPTPTLAEQRRIAALLYACDAELERLRAQLTALKQQKKGLMQKLLTGEVRISAKGGVENVS